MKVIFIVPRLRSSGPTTQLGYIVRSLLEKDDERHIDLEIVTLRNEGVKSDMSALKELNGLQVISTADWKSLVRTIIYIKNFKNEVVISSGLFAELICFLFAPKKLWISVVRSYPPEDFKDKFGEIFGGLLSGLSLYLHRKSKRCIAVSQSLRDRLSLIGLDAITVRNAVASVNAESIVNVEKISNTFLIVGNLRRLKNVHSGIELFLRCRKPEDELYILGDGPLKQELVDSYKCHPSIKFFGHVDSVTPFYVTAKCLISLSSSEGMPNAVMEALSWGVPCILSPISAHNELRGLIPDGVFICDQDDSQKDIVQKKKLATFLVAGRLNRKLINRQANDALNTSLLSEQYLAVIKQVSNDF
tara:strand:- start:264 stop:1343 length:1080 start_codon:yes stop_codon:yes gene_type:complete